MTQEFKLSGSIKKDSKRPLTSEELALQECDKYFTARQLNKRILERP